MIAKVISTALIGFCSIAGMTSCTAKPTQQPKEENKTETTEMKTDGKKLVVVFSHTGENYNVGVIEKGNTHIIAALISPGRDITAISSLVS